jgi:hypothetical protein
MEKAEQDGQLMDVITSANNTFTKLANRKTEG